MMTTVRSTARAVHPDARRERLVNLIPLVWSWVEAGDVFSDLGRERLLRASRWLERNGLILDTLRLRAEAEQRERDQQTSWEEAEAAATETSAF